MFCDKCGAENRNSARFCYKCGEDISAIPTTERRNVPGVVAEKPHAARIDESTKAEYLHKLLNYRYQLKDLLGCGGMGMVYRAYDNQLKMDVAIKFLLSRYTGDLAAIESLKNEAKAAMRLAHPNIVRLYNFEDTPELKYLLMEYIQGESLAALAGKRTGRRLSEPEVIRFMCDTCEALTYAHRESIIHRDIKPSNILLTSDGRLKLADFGIALIHEKVSADSDDIAGTPSYMSPEQILGQPLDGRSDIYSLGVTMYEMLTGKPPFRGKDTRFQYISMLPAPINGISDWLNGIILKCLRKEPDGRWSNAEELRDVLAGKREGGLALKAKFQPWWVVAEDLRNNGPARSKPTPVPAPQPLRVAVEAPPKPEKATEMPPPECKRAEIQKNALPPSSVRTRERVEKIERYSGLLEYAAEREHARVEYSTIAGIVAGLLFFFLSASLEKVLSRQVVLQLNFTFMGVAYGIAVGLAHKKLIRGALAFSFGALGGIIAGSFIRIDPAAAALHQAQLPQNMLLCAAVLGAALGIADGLYAQSPLYLIRCVFWGAFGGAGGCATFLLLRHLFSAFWSPLPQWTILGAALGFSIFMGIGLAKKPGIDEQPQKHENRLL